jgi:hypothetical protein
MLKYLIESPPLQSLCALTAGDLRDWRRRAARGGWMEMLRHLMEPPYVLSEKDVWDTLQAAASGAGQREAMKYLVELARRYPGGARGAISGVKWHSRHGGWEDAKTYLESLDTGENN